MRRVGIRELRQQLSRVIDAVEGGETVEVTRAGRPVARIAPLQAVSPEVARLLATGQAHGTGRLLRLPRPAPLVGEGPTIAEMILADREERHRAVLGE